MELKKGQLYKDNPSHNIQTFYDSQMNFLWDQNHSPDIPDLISGTLSGSGTMTLYSYRDTLKVGLAT
jgi:hypothetical protein